MLKKYRYWLHWLKWEAGMRFPTIFTKAFPADTSKPYSRRTARLEMLEYAIGNRIFQPGRGTYTYQWGDAPEPGLYDSYKEIEKIKKEMADEAIRKETAKAETKS